MYKLVLVDIYKFQLIFLFVNENGYSYVIEMRRYRVDDVIQSICEGVM